MLIKYNTHGYINRVTEKIFIHAASAFAELRKDIDYLQLDELIWLWIKLKIENVEQTQKKPSLHCSLEGLDSSKNFSSCFSFNSILSLVMRFHNF